LKIGGRWVQLRLCEFSGHAGCCDSSPNRHATKHYHATTHPIVKSFEHGEEWKISPGTSGVFGIANNPNSPK
jgi:hypothetical protein